MFVIYSIDSQWIFDTKHGTIDTKYNTMNNDIKYDSMNNQRYQC